MHITNEHQDRWRNGSAFDSRSKGYPFKSGVVQFPNEANLEKVDILCSFFGLLRGGREECFFLSDKRDAGKGARGVEVLGLLLVLVLLLKRENRKRVDIVDFTTACPSIDIRHSTPRRHRHR